MLTAFAVRLADHLDADLKGQGARAEMGVAA
jgi:hypothetical protein